MFINTKIAGKITNYSHKQNYTLYNASGNVSKYFVKYEILLILTEILASKY